MGKNSFVLSVILVVILLATACQPVPQPSTGGQSQGVYGQAPDYTWLKGQVQVTTAQGGCTLLVYDPKGADQYGGKVVLSGQTDGLKTGQWVTVFGSVDKNTKVVCLGATTAYQVTRVEAQASSGQVPPTGSQATPSAPGSGQSPLNGPGELGTPSANQTTATSVTNSGGSNISAGSGSSSNSGSNPGSGSSVTPGPTVPVSGNYGRAADYSWLKGQVIISAAQGGGCTELVYDPNGGDQYGGRVILHGDLTSLKNQELITAFGAVDPTQHEVCPLTTTVYNVTQIKTQP